MGEQATNTCLPARTLPLVLDLGVNREDNAAQENECSLSFPCVCPAMKRIVTLDRDERGILVAEGLSIFGCVSPARIKEEALDNIHEAIKAVSKPGPKVAGRGECPPTTV